MNLQIKILTLSLALGTLSLLISHLLKVSPMANQRTVVIIGGGLAGLSASHTALDAGAKVVLLDKKPSYVFVRSIIPISELEHLLEWGVILLKQVQGSTVQPRMPSGSTMSRILSSCCECPAIHIHSRY